MKKFQILGAAALALGVASCGIVEEMSSGDDTIQWAFGQDLSFFASNGADCLVLGEGDSFLAVSPKWQGRVLTSTLAGEEGPSLGWYNRTLVASGKEEKAFYLIGGEDKFALGPQGGDMSIYFGAGKLFTSENWKSPKVLSSDPWKLIDHSKTQARFEKYTEIENARGSIFKILVEREVSFISRADTQNVLGIKIPDSVKSVAFQSFNKVTNKGDSPWDLNTGMVNISVQSCFNANGTTAAFIPYKKGDVKELGDIIRNEYNANLQGEPLYFVEPDYIKFKLDAHRLERLGVNAKRSKGIIVTYDARNSLLTVITYLRPASPKGYMSSSWRRIDPVGEGDAINIFNNGPAAQGSFYAVPFYEISTHSPALALEPGKSQLHLQRTFHFSGSEYDLGLIAYALTGVSMKQMRGE